MPNDGREYTFKFNVDNKSLQSAADNIAQTLNEAIKDGTTLDRSSISSVKSSLGQIFGVAEKEAENLKRAMSGITKLDDSQIKMMADNLGDVLNVASQITEAMKATGNSLDWMKQGATLVDDFRNLKAAVDKVPLDKFEAMEASITRLSTQFQGFIDAFKVNDPAGFFKRFGAEAEKEAKHIESIKARLEKAQKKGSLDDAIARGREDADTVEDFIGYSAEDIDEEYARIKQDLIANLEEIDRIKKKYTKNNKVDEKKLYVDQDYQRQMRGLTAAYYSLEALQKATTGPLGITVNTTEIEKAAQDAANVIKEAKSDLETVIKGLDLKDIELSVVLPDAKSAEFSAKINEFIDETKNQLNAKPIKVDIDLTTPVKTKRGKNLTKGQEENAQKIAKEYTDIFNQVFESKEGEEVDKRLTDATSALFDKQSTVSAQKFLESFLKVVKTVTNSQELLLEATKKWRNEIDEQLKLKFAWQTRENEADHKADLAWLFNLANQEAAKNPILLTVDDEYFLGQIENALKERTFTLNADVGTVTGNIAGNINVIPSDNMYQYQPQIQAPVPQQPVSSNIDDTSVEENTDAVHQSTETSRKSTTATNALERAVIDLGEKIQRNETRWSTIDKNIKEQQAIAEQNKDKVADQQASIAAYSKRQAAESETKQQAMSDLTMQEKELQELSDAYSSKARELYQKLQKIKESSADYVKVNAIEQEIEKLKANFKDENKFLLDYQQRVVGSKSTQNNEYNKIQTLRNQIQTIKESSEEYAAIKSVEQEIAKLKADFRANKNKLEGKIEATKSLIDMSQRGFGAMGVAKDNAYAEIEVLTGKSKIESAIKSQQKIEYENKNLAYRKQAIEKLIESGDNPITLVTNSINRFWTKSEQSVTSAMTRMQKIDGDSAKLQKELYSLESAFEKTEQGTDAYNSLAEQIATVRDKLQESLNKLSDKDKKSFNNAVSRYSNELTRQSFMESKGLIKGLDNGAVEALLKKSPTLAYDLSHMKDKHADLSDTQSIQNLAYFTSVVQENMGMVAKTASEWETDNDAQERFINMFKVIRYINDLNKLLVNNQNGADEASIQKFIDTYKHIPDMQNAVTAATTYLDSVYKLSEHTKGNELYQIADELGITGEYFADAVKKAWDKLSNTEKAFMETKGVKVTDKSLKYNQKVFEDESQYSISKNVLDFVDVLKTHAEYKETQGNLSRMLQEASRRFTSGTKSGLRVMLDDEKPLAVRVVDANGAEKIYGIQRKNTARINADRSFNTTSSGLENFLKESGLYDVINEIVDKELSADENDQKLAKQLREELFTSGKYKVSSQRDAFVKTSGKDYKFKGSSYEQALQKRDAITKELERLNSQEEIDSIKILKEQKTQELAAVNAFLQSQEERVAAIAALDGDIAIAEAKLVDKKQSLDAYNKTARNLTGSRTSRGELYKEQQKRIRAIAGSRAVSVDELGDQLNIAQQYGTMDSSVVSELQTMLKERNALFAELQQMSKSDQKDSPRGKEIKKQLADYRTQIARKFYETDGWYITELLTGRLKEIDSDFNAENLKIGSNDKKSQQDYQAQIDALKSAYSKRVEDIETHFNDFEMKILGSQEEALSPQMSEELKAAERTYQQGQADIEKQRINIVNKVNKDLEGFKKELYEKQLTEIAPLREEASKYQDGSSEKNAINQQIKAIENKYRAQLKQKTDTLITAEYEQLGLSLDKLEKVYKDTVTQIIASNDDIVIRTYNEVMQSEGEPEAKSVEEIRARIQKQKEAALQKAAQEHQEALAKITAPTDSSADLLNTAEAKDVAKQIAVQSLSGSDGKFKSDAAAMAEVARKGAENAQIAVDAAKQNVINLKAKKDALQKETEATNKVVKANEEAAAANRTNTNIAENRAAPTSYSSGGYVAGGVINTSGLATENTLRGIYELLNGGAPAGGWGDNRNSFVQDEGFSDGLGKSTQNFVQSISSIIAEAETRTTEAGYLINRFGQVGAAIQGTAHSVPAAQIKDALAKHIADGIAAVLHNHPTRKGTAQHLSPGDVYSSYYRAYEDQNPIKITGSVNKGVITALDWTSIDKSIAQQIVNRYAALMNEYQATMPDVFTYDEVKKKYNANADKIDSDPSLIKLISNKYNEILKQALSEFGYENIFKQFDASNLEDFGKLITGSQQEVAETIVENAAEAAKQAAVKADITVDKGKLDELKTKLDQRYQKEKTDRINKVENPFKRPDDEATLSKGIGNISNTLFQDYNSLNKNQANAKLAELANGYIRLQKFIETELYKSLQEDTKEIINNAIKSAKSVLDANGVQIRGKDTLVGKVIQESYLKNSSGQTLIKGSRSNNPAEAGKIISSVNSPAIIRGQDVLQPAFVTSHKPKNTEEKKLVAEVLGLEKQVTQEQQKQVQLTETENKQDKQAVDNANKKVEAEKKTTKAKNESKNTQKNTIKQQPTAAPPVQPIVADGSGSTRETSNQGGIIGILNQLAREETLSSIATLLSSKGITSENGSASSDKQKASNTLSAASALEKLKSEVNKLSGVTKMSNMRTSAKGYSLDVYREELGKIEKITLNINKNTGEITSKTAFQDLALGANAAEKELQKVANIQEQLIDNKAVKYDDAGNLFGNNEAVNKYLSSVKELRNYRDSLSTKELFAPENQKRLNSLSLTVQNYRKQVEALLKTSTQFSGGDVLGSISDPNIVNNMSQVKQVMSDLVSQSTDGQVTFGNLKVVTDNLGNSYYTLSYQMKNGKHEVQEMTAVLNPLTHEIIAQKGALKPVQTGWEKFFAGFKGKLTSITQYMASITSIHAIISQFRQGLQYVKEIDAAMTELKKVTDETDATYQKFLQTASKTAGVIGSTVKDFTNATADFARLGYNINEASQLAEASLIYKNVGDGFSDVSEASESIISTMKAFGIEATDTMGIVDRFNEVGNNFAITSKGIGDALQKSASALVEGGNTIDEAIALVTGANSVVQNPEIVGTALKTLSLRLRGAKVELEEAGEETDGMATSVSQLQKKLLALTNGKVNIMLDANTFKNTTQILREMSTVWEDMTDIQQAAALELMGGKRQANILSSIISNFQTVEDVIKTSANSAGSAIKENEKYLDSIQGKIDQFTNALQTMWMNLIDSDAVKTVVSAGTALIQIFDNIQKTIGTIPAIIAVIAGYNIAKIFFQWVAAIQKVALANMALVASEKAGANAKTATAKASALKEQQMAKENLVTAQNTKKNLENAMSFEGIGQALKNIVKTPIGKIGIIITILSAVIAIYKKYKQTEQEAAETARQQADSIKELNDSLEDYKNQISKLRTELDNGNLSEEEAYDTRKQLINIQDELISKFGKEAESINLVTGTIRDQISAIDELAKKNAEQWLNDNSKKQKMWGIFPVDSAINQAIEAMETTYNTSSSFGTTVWTDVFKDAYGDDWNRYNKEAAQEYQTFIESLGGTLDLKSNTIRFKDITREQLDDYYSQIENWLREYGTKNGLDFSKLIGKIETEKEDKLGENYETHKANYDAYLENTAIASYTEAYGKILDAEDEFLKASTDKDRLSKINDYEQNVADAFKEAGGTIGADGSFVINKEQGNASMQKYFADMQNKFAQEEFKLKVKLNEDDLKTDLQRIINEGGEKGLSSLDDIAIQDMIDRGLNVDGAIDESGKYTQEQITGLIKLQAEADNAGISIDNLISILTNLGLIAGDPTNKAAESVKSIGQAYSILSASVEKYAELNDILNEITYDNIEITEEQYNTLKELIGSEEEFNECIDTSNGYIVTNTELLNKLIKSNKKDAAANVKLSRTQARLRYYDLYKKMHKLTNGQNQLTGAALDEVNALYDQMSAIEKTIAKYSLLEAKLLGVTNVYTDLALAQAADEEMDYGSKAEELVNVLANAFNTAELGTEAAQVAISGLIPDDVIDKTKTLDEQMQQIYKYFTSGKLTKLFTIKFDDDGGIESVEMTKKNIESFVNELLKTELPDGLGTIFEGSWDEFTLNPAITSLEQFAEACGLTEEVAFSFLTSLEKYDISWLGDDFSTLLDQLMGDDLEYQLYNKMQRIADLEVKMANGTITSEEQSTYGKLIGEMETLEEQAVTNVTKYAELSGQLDDTKQEMIDLNKELENTEEGSEAYKSLEKKIKDAQEKASKLVKDMEDLGEPTELTLEVALDEAQEQIDEFKSGLNQWAKDNGKNKQIVVKINTVIDTIDSTGIEELGLTKNEDGTWSGLANIKGYSELDEESKAKVVEYLNLINSKHTIDALMGDGITTVEQHLERIVEILEETYRLTVEAKVDDEEVVTFIDWLKNTPFTKIVTFTAKKIGSWLGFGDDDSSDDNDSGSGGGGSSGGFANGTAHATGSWGASKTETALVGELGPEMVVRNGRWFTVGENGAEFTDIKKGDIIFNHKQTEDLLSKGYVTGRGKAYASGTAYAGINTWDDAYNKVSKDYGNKGSKGSDDDIKDEVKEVVDFIEIKLEEIEAIISKTSAKLELLRDDTSQTKYKDQMYNQLIQAEKNKANTYLQAYNEYNKRASDLLKKVPEKYRDLAKNGGIKIEDFIDKGESDANAKIVEAINDYREWATKADEVEMGYYESLQQQAAYRLQQIEDIADDFENLVQVINTESTLLQSEMDLVTESGGRLSENHYNRLIELKEAELDRKEKEKKQLQRELNNALAEGTIEYGTDEWYQAIDLIASVDDEIVQCQIDMEKFSNEAQNIQWDNLDRLIERFDTLDSQISHLYDRFTDNDKVVDDKGNWTNEGIAAMGMLVQQMEIAKVKSDQYADAIKQLNKDYKKGLYSPDEYNEKLAELTEQQWESIEAYEDAKDSLVDLNKTRIDAVKDGMQKEIDAYKELIDKKKESLDADKDAYDFEKNVQKQTKNIQAIERKIAALRGDTSMSAAAQRKELEAELLEAKAELEDTFYERSVENQKDALDNEYENYEKSMNKEMEALDEYLENSEQVVLDSINTVKNNASIVLQEIKEISRQYGIDISNSIADPWRDGSNAISDYQEGFKNLSSSFIEELDKIIAQEEELQKSADRAAKALAKTVNQTVQEYTKEPAKKPDKSSPSEQAKQPTLPTKPDTSKEESKKSVEKAPPTKGDKVTVKKTATHFSSKSGSKKMASFVPGSTYTVYQVSGSQVLIGRNGEYTGWVNLKDLQGYAKGTTGVKNDQFAWIDEVGEELILHAGNDGKLTYLSKGTSVIPSDITNKLLDLVVDPTQTLENSRPIISAPHIVNNEITIDASIGEVIHIDSVSNDTLPNLEKVVEKQMDKYVKNLNNQIRKYSR